MRVWIYLKSWEWNGKDHSNPANLYEKIREIICKESVNIMQQKSASFVGAYLSILPVVVE
jgi:hypothetical protein